MIDTGGERSHIKKIVSSLLAAAVLAACLLCPAAAAADASPWAEPYIQDAAEVYGLPGYRDGADYSRELTKEEFCAYLLDASKYVYHKKTRKTTEIEDKETFLSLDVPELTGMVKNAVYSSGNRADARITRAETARALAYAAGYFGFMKFPEPSKFSDIAAVSSETASAIGTVCGIGLMRGGGDGTFAPDGKLTLEQCAAVMVRLVGAFPYLNNRKQIAGNRYFIFNEMHLWVQDSAEKLIFSLPYEDRQTPSIGYGGCTFFTSQGKLICAAYRYSAETELFDVESGKSLLTVGGTFYALDRNGDIITSRTHYSAPTVDASYELYGDSAWDGTVIVPPDSEWSVLYDRGLVDASSPVFYSWQ